MGNAISELYRYEQDSLVGEMFKDTDCRVWAIGSKGGNLRFITVDAKKNLRDVTFLIEGILGGPVAYHAATGIDGVEESVNGVLGRTLYLSFFLLNPTT